MELEVRDASKKARKSHRKSRLGCLQCKARKIKCDENKPNCNNCVKHEIDCNYRPSKKATTPTSPNVAAPSITSDESTTRESVESRQTIDLLDINSIQLELLHNYTTSTAYTLAYHSVSQTIWRVAVPQIGFQTTFVMRAILALSALHLAHCKPRQKDNFTAIATSQHELALREATAALTNISADNGTALYLFSALTALIACAKPKTNDDLLFVSNNSVAEWLALFRGTRSIILTQGDTLRSGPLSPMLALGKRKSDLRTKFGSQEHPELHVLADLVKSSVKEVKDLQAYDKAVVELRKSYAATLRPDSPSPETSDVFIWVFEVPDEYFKLLAEQKQTALSILAFYCPVMHRLEGMWWMQGWASHLMRFIYHNLDQEHRMWIQWPMQQIGWIN